MNNARDKEFFGGRVLVTGGRDSSDRICAKYCWRAATKVLCVDNFFTADGATSAICCKIRVLSADASRCDVPALCRGRSDLQSRLSPASPVHYQFDPVQTTKTSVVGAINMLGLAKRLKIPVLQASTSEVYGDPTQHSTNRELLGQRQSDWAASCYDEANAAPRPCSLTIVPSTTSTSRSFVYSTLTVRACTPPTARGFELHRAGAPRRRTLLLW